MLCTVVRSQEGSQQLVRTAQRQILRVSNFIGITSVHIYIESNASLRKLISRQRKKINAINVAFVEAFKYSRLVDCIFQPARYYLQDVGKLIITQNSKECKRKESPFH